MTINNNKLPAAGLTLDDLPVAGRAVLGPPTSLDATVLRLLEMGMTEGTVVVLTRRAPFGDPLELALRGTRLCLRRLDARRFPITLAPGAVG